MPWTTYDEFVAFSFGDFDSAGFGTGNTNKIYRVGDSDKYTINLAPPMNDIVTDIPGGDGQYYFGTLHKPKVFTVNFVFDNLNDSGIAAMKTAFGGKELKQLRFAEEKNQVYIAKVTGQPNIKVVPFDVGSVTIYKGEGTVEFTAYWPYAKSSPYPTETPATFSIRQMSMPSPSDGSQTKNTGLTAGATRTSIEVPNPGDIPTYFQLTSDVSISKVSVGNDEIISGNNIKYWNSQTGIIKSNKNGNGDPIDYSGEGLYRIPVGGTTLVVDHSAAPSGSNITIKYDYWYN